MSEKLTARDKFTALITAMRTGETTIDPETLAQFCEAEIEKLDKKAAKARERAAAKKAESDELTEIVFDALHTAALSSDEFMTRAAIMDALDGKIDEDVTINKVGARLNKLVAANRVEKSEVSVERDGKKSKMMAYRAM